MSGPSSQFNLHVYDSEVSTRSMKHFGDYVSVSVEFDRTEITIFAPVNKLREILAEMQSALESVS